MRWAALVVLVGIQGLGCARRDDPIAVATVTPIANADTGAPCAVSPGGTNLEPCAATYLGGPGPDEANAVDLGADGAIVVGGPLPVCVSILLKNGRPVPPFSTLIV